MTTPVAVRFPLAVWLPVNVFEAANSGTFVVSTFKVVLPPRETEPPPVSAVPGVIVNDGFASMALVTPAVAMLNDPLEVIGPPVSPAPVPTLVTVPLPVPVPGNVCPVAKVIWPLLPMCKPVSAGLFVPEE